MLKTHNYSKTYGTNTLEVDYTYDPGDPGVHTFSNGDPGYPPTSPCIDELKDVRVAGVSILDVLEHIGVDALEVLEEELLEHHHQQTLNENI
jgi:hypothetical protein